MTKTTLVWVILLCSCFVSVGQNSLDEIKKEYDSLIKNTNYGNNPDAGKYYDIRGFKMYCETYGEGEPLLLIHGNGSSISAFVKQIPFFSKEYKVIVADSRNHGKSVDKLDSLSYEMMADDYAALLSQMKIDSAYVLGWSDGGVNGLLMAIRHPEKVKKLVITGANLQPDSSAVSTDVLKRITKTYNMFEKMFSEKVAKTPLDSIVYKYVKLLAEQPNIHVGELHKISAPTLVVGGDHDVIKPGHTLKIFQNIPKAYLWILPNSGHYTLVTHADEFNRIANEFFITKYRKIEDRDRDF
ncbi:alpha/beta fold hydrolase [Arenibacter echinorum]|uniref:Pimeloyl-ACP methyl ester carboxylesterase n=1 Tax=Arenibacter echinorum TaxID=440515 RepID=A0A327RII7_9FLAO|nr:alpha/beta hydrolase [Arenibacter echinorum]RAJ15323.1 pimeloyl-ACP methyl ester carboxylesterase [Arenibacter echinorum]